MTCPLDRRIYRIFGTPLVRFPAFLLARCLNTWRRETDTSLLKLEDRINTWQYNSPNQRYENTF